MGQKRVSVRTLPSGERVKHSPDGTQELIRDRSPLREKLAADREKKKQRHDAIHERHLQRIEIKKNKQQDLPNEKSVI